MIWCWGKPKEILCNADVSQAHGTSSQDYAVNSNYRLRFPESVPGIAAKHNERFARITKPERAAKDGEPSAAPIRVDCRVVGAGRQTNRLRAGLKTRRAEFNRSGGRPACRRGRHLAARNCGSSFPRTQEFPMPTGDSTVLSAGRDACRYPFANRLSGGHSPHQPGRWRFFAWQSGATGSPAFVQPIGALENHPACVQIT